MACPYIVELAVVQVTPLALMTDHPCKLVPVFKILLIQAQVFLFVCCGGGGGGATIISITCKLNLVGTSGHKSSACSTVISIITSLYLWKFHSLLFSYYTRKPVAPPSLRFVVYFGASSNRAELAISFKLLVLNY